MSGASLPPRERTMNRLAPSLVALSAIAFMAFVSACASSGSAGGDDGPVGSDRGRGTIQMLIWNRSDETVEVFARWGNNRARLGRLRGNRRGTYLAYVQGPVVAISWDVLTARPPAATAFGGDFPDVADSPGDPQCPLDTSGGDRLEWTIEADSRTCSYIRLDPAGL